MGGAGSGTWQRPDTRTTVEESPSLDILRLRRSGHLKANARAALQWQAPWAAGLEDHQVRLYTEAARVHISYRMIGESGDTTMSAAVEWEPCPLGGSRPWWRCPECGRRTAKLYLPPERWRFACRQCHDLVYWTQRAPDTQRLRKRLNRLRDRVDDRPVSSRRRGDLAELLELERSLPMRPTGMHRATYARLGEEYDAMWWQHQVALALSLQPLLRMNQRQTKFWQKLGILPVEQGNPADT